jgi:hypothetical protein
MKRKIVLAVALVLTMAFVSQLNSVTSVRAQPPQRFRFETGVAKLGPNQIMRLTVFPDWGDGTARSVRFGQTAYTQDGCNGDGVCKLTGTNTFTGPITLMPGEIASYDILAAGTYGRGIVLTNDRNAHVNASIIDATTGRVDAVVIGLLIP